MQSSSLFNALDKLVLEVLTIKVPAGFGGIKTRGRPLAILAHFKKSNLRVKSETNCLAHALITAIAKITDDPNYRLYCQGRKLGHLVRQLLETSICRGNFDYVTLNTNASFILCYRISSVIIPCLL